MITYILTKYETVKAAVTAVIAWVKDRWTKIKAVFS